MSERSTVDRTDALSARMRQHVRKRDGAGVVTSFVIDREGHVMIDAQSVNVSRGALRCVATDLLVRYREEVAACQCGLDHGHEVAELDAALFALRPAAEAPDGH